MQTVYSLSILFFFFDRDPVKSPVFHLLASSFLAILFRAVQLIITVLCAAVNIENDSSCDLTQYFEFSLYILA